MSDPMLGLIDSHSTSGMTLPNFLVLFVDDMGLNQVALKPRPGLYGYTGDNGTIATPNVAKLAEEGMTFQHWYSSFHYCSPSRASMLTGRLPVRLGIGIPPCDYAPKAYPFRNCNGVFTAEAVGGLPLNETTTAEVLRARGYATAACGKWHLGQREEYLPHMRGFDEYFGVPFSQDMGLSFWEHTKGDKPNPPFQPTPLPLLHATSARGGASSNATIVEQPVDLGTLVPRYVDFASRFIQRSAAASTSFYLYFPFNHIHEPNSCGASFCGRSARGPVGDATEESDWAVGEIMRALADHGVAHNTLTFYTSDNGAPLGNDNIGNWPLRGGKAQVWEGGFREPGIVHWPGRIRPGSISHAIASTLDIHPTILKLAGVPLPTDRVIDGIDLSPILFGSFGSKAAAMASSNNNGRRALSLDAGAAGGHACYYFYRAAAAVNASGELFAVRCGDFKAYYATWGVAPPKPYKPGLQDPPLLFDLIKDPGENAPLLPQSTIYKAALTTIDAAKATHLATINPHVPDQNGRGSEKSYAICSDPDSQKKWPHLPNCTLTPESWRPQAICASQACLMANPAFKARCAHEIS